MFLHTTTDVTPSFALYSLFYHKVLLNLPPNSWICWIIRVPIPFAWLEHLSHLESLERAKVNLHPMVHLTNSSTGLRQKLPRTAALRSRKVHRLRPKELHPQVHLPGDGCEWCDELPRMKSENCGYLWISVDAVDVSWQCTIQIYPGLVQFHSISWLCASGRRRPRETTAWVCSVIEKTTAKNSFQKKVLMQVHAHGLWKFMEPGTRPKHAKKESWHLTNSHELCSHSIFLELTRS